MNDPTRRPVVVAGAAIAAGRVAWKASAQTQPRAKPEGVSPAELAHHEKYMRLAIAQAHRGSSRTLA